MSESGDEREKREKPESEPVVPPRRPLPKRPRPTPLVDLPPQPKR